MTLYQALQLVLQLFATCAGLVIAQRIAGKVSSMSDQLGALSDDFHHFRRVLGDVADETTLTRFAAERAAAAGRVITRQQSRPSIPDAEPPPISGHRTG